MFLPRINLMKKSILFACIFFCGLSLTVHAADLIEVYNQAQNSDTIFQQAIAERLSTKEGVPITAAGLLPNIAIQGNASLTRTGVSGTDLSTFDNLGTLYPRNTTTRAYNIALTVSQAIFDFSKYSSVAGAVARSKAADATLNSALQNLMVRTATAYFNVLRDEDNVLYSEASKRAFEEQLSQIQEQYNVGLKTITDLYTAQASYDSAVARVIAAETELTNDRENLRVITGIYYPHLLTLSENFPLLTPQPADIEAWVRIAQLQNWAIRRAQYYVESGLHNIRQQFAGHLPTIYFQGQVNRSYSNNLNHYRNLIERNGPGTQTNRQAALTFNVPLFSGGAVTAQTNRATYDYQVAQQQLERTIRNTLNTTRQSYLGIISGKSQINADIQTIKSTISSLHGMEASYQVGTETLYNVLNQQQKVYEAQTQYAKDRYNFVINILLLKQAAGTLSFDDLRGINAWLIDRNASSVNKKTLLKRYRHKKIVKKKKVK